MVALFGIKYLAESSSRTWNRIWQLFWEDFFRSLEHTQGYWVIIQELSMADWTTDSGRWSDILKTTALLAIAIRSWAYWVTESKKCPVASRLLAAVSLDGSMRLASVFSFNDKSLICCTLISKSPSIFEISTVFTLELLNISINGAEHAFWEIWGLNVFWMQLAMLWIGQWRHSMGCRE